MEKRNQVLAARHAVVAAIVAVGSAAAAQTYGAVRPDTVDQVVAASWYGSACVAALQTVAVGLAAEVTIVDSSLGNFEDLEASFLVEVVVVAETPDVAVDFEGNFVPSYVDHIAPALVEERETKHFAVAGKTATQLVRLVGADETGSAEQEDPVAADEEDRMVDFVATADLPNGSTGLEIEASEYPVDPARMDRVRPSQSTPETVASGARQAGRIQVDVHTDQTENSAGMEFSVTAPADTDEDSGYRMSEEFPQRDVGREERISVDHEEEKTEALEIQLDIEQGEDDLRKNREWRAGSKVSTDWETSFRPEWGNTPGPLGFRQEESGMEAAEN